MSVISFWNDNKGQIGQTLSVAAIATHLAIAHNYKILVLSTSFKDTTLSNCFWSDAVKKKTAKFLGRGNGIAITTGIEGLSKLINSNKLEPGVITDYTKVVFKGRLEVLPSFQGTEDENDNDEEQFEMVKKGFLELIQSANQYYDIVLVDIDNNLNADIKESILNYSNLSIYFTTQRLKDLNSYIEKKTNGEFKQSPKSITAITRYDRNSKYNIKNLTKFLSEKKDLSVIPYNTLFFEASEEASVPDLFLRMRKIKDTSDTNYYFINEIEKMVQKIIYRLQELQMKMR